VNDCTLTFFVRGRQPVGEGASLGPVEVEGAGDRDGDDVGEGEGKPVEGAGDRDGDDEGEGEGAFEK
jgi:hypothetical protein